MFLQKMQQPVFLPVAFGAWYHATKETTLERIDFTLQLLMFKTVEKEKRMFMSFFLSIFCQDFRLEQPERVHTMKAQTYRPERQLFLM